MRIYTTTSFKRKYDKLRRINKHYACISERLSDFLFARELTPRGDLLRRNETTKAEVYKARLKSCTKNGKSYGFRIAYLVLPDYVILLEIYPKWGPKAADDITPEGVSYLLAEALGEKEDSTLLELKINEKKKIVFQEQIEEEALIEPTDEEE